MQFVIIWQILINRETSGLAARPKLSSRPGQNQICCNPALLQALLNAYSRALTLDVLQPIFSQPTELVQAQQKELKHYERFMLTPQKNERKSLAQ